MSDITYDISVLLLLVSALLGIIIAFTYGMRVYLKAATFKEPPLSDLSGLRPKASVLIYCQNDEETLDHTLAQLSTQDYPDFEVIVICDSSDEHASLLGERYSLVYENVYVTFVQPGSHNLSRRKLAMTIGAKAAKGEILVTTAANILIPSDQWLSSLLAPFCGEQGKYIDVSLGFARMNFSELRGPWKWYRQFDSFLTNALWIGYAAIGHPYRGDGYNLAFRREVFFRHKGYAKTINLHNGDDDLFIDEISNSANTRVVVGENNIIETQWGQSANRVWSMRKERYSFTSRWLPHAPFVRSYLMMALQWIIPAVCTLAAILGLPSYGYAIAAAVMLLLFWIGEIYCYRALARRLGGVRLWWAVIPFWLWRPIGDMFFRYDHLSSRKKNFTWQR